MSEEIQEDGSSANLQSKSATTDYGKDESVITKFEIYKYVGKELKKEATKESGKTWKLFTLKFDIGREFPFTLSCFDTIGTKEDSKGLTLKALEEGNYYNVGFNVVKEAFEAHGKKHDSRTCFFIKDSSEEDYTKSKEKQLEERTSTQTSSPTTNTKTEEVDDKALESFWSKYQEMKVETRTVTHAVNTWFFNKHYQEYSKVFSYMKEAFKPKEEEIKAIPEEDLMPNEERVE